MHPVMRKMTLSLLMAVGAVLTTGCESTGPTGLTGTYTGTTESGGSVQIEVEGNKVSLFKASDISLEVGICELSEVEITFTNVPFSGSSFAATDKGSRDGVDFTIGMEGEFASTGSVKGAVTFTAEGLCTGTASDAFTAKRDT